MIDLVFTSEEDVINALHISPPLGKSDHSVIELDCKISTSSENQKKTRYKYDKGDYSKLADLLNIDWDTCTDNVEAQWCKFKSIFDKSIEETIPIKVINRIGKRKQDPKHTIPLNKKALSKIKRKERLWTRCLNTREGEAYKEYCKARNQVRTLTRKITKQFDK